MTTSQTTRTLVAETCCFEGCGVLFGLESDHHKRLRDTHSSFFCPNGHRMHYTGKSDAEKERERAERAEGNVEFYRSQMTAARADRDSALHKVRAERGAKTKLQKKLTRVAHGVCPCCNRSFANLKRHMSGQHPAFAPELTK